MRNMADQMRLPSGQGGLMRFDESTSKIKISPGAVVVLCLLVILVVVLLHYFGA